MNNSATNTDEYLAALPDWQKQNLELFRKLVHEASPDFIEVIKWGVPVFMLGKKMVFAMSSFKAHTKYNFIANGAQLNDHEGLFNNGLESKTARAIDLKQDEAIDGSALQSLIAESLRMITA